MQSRLIIRKEWSLNARRTAMAFAPTAQILPLSCDSIGADDGIRTRDPNLGKVVLYQLSHVRVRPSL